VPSIAAVSSNLLKIATAREPPHPYWGPAEFGHHPGEPPARAGATIALRDLQNVEHGLGGDALDAIVAYSGTSGMTAAST